MRKLLIALVAMLALTGAACSSGGDDTGTATGGGTTGTGSTGAGSGCTAANAIDLTDKARFTVKIKDLAFHPDCFVAKSSSAITIKNVDTVTHTFTIDGTPVDVSIDGGQTFNGESAGLDPGTYPFHCKIHSTMTGTVIVT